MKGGPSDVTMSPGQSRGLPPVLASERDGEDFCAPKLASDRVTRESAQKAVRCGEAGRADNPPPPSVGERDKSADG